MPALEVAQMHVVSQLPLQRARFQFSIGEILRLMAHHRFDRQLFGDTPGKANRTGSQFNVVDNMRVYTEQEKDEKGD